MLAQTRDIPQSLRDYLAQVRPLPDAMLQCRGFKEAVLTARAIHWRRKIEKLSALAAWVTRALILDDHTQPYMAKLIQDEAAGFQWEMAHSVAVHDAAVEIERTRQRDRKRDFLAHRKAIVRALRDAQERMNAIGWSPELRELLREEDLRGFRENVWKFEESASLARLGRAADARDSALRSGATAEQAFAAAIAVRTAADDWQTPSFERLLSVAESQIANLPPPKTDKHTPCSLYMRGLFPKLEHSEIASRRVAFLVHASKAVFGATVDKKSVRRLVADYTKIERERKAWHADEKTRAAEGVELQRFLEECDAKPVKGKKERAERKKQLLAWKEKVASWKSPYSEELECARRRST